MTKLCGTQRKSAMYERDGLCYTNLFPGARFVRVGEARSLIALSAASSSEQKPENLHRFRTLRWIQTTGRVPKGCSKHLSQRLGLERTAMPIAFDVSKLILAPCHLGNVQPEAGGCYGVAQDQGSFPLHILVFPYTEASLCDLAMRAALGQHARTMIAMDGV